METNRDSLVVLSAKDLQAMGFSRPMVYQLLNRKDMPVIQIGGRKFLHKAKFFEWLETQADRSYQKQTLERYGD